MPEPVAPVVAAAPVPAAPAAAPAPAPAAAAPAPAAPAPAAAPAAPADPGLITPPAAAPAAPAKIELKLPEGWKANEGLMGKFLPIAQELGLDSPKAQKLADVYIGAVKDNLEAADADWKKQQATWASEVKADKEMGGQAFETTKVEVKRFFDAFDKDGSIRKDIAALGLSNHPALVRLAVRASKLVKEDSSAVPGAFSAAAPNDEAVLRARFPTMFPPQ